MKSELRSLTTRSPREGETERDYDFILKSKFDYLLKYDKLLEHTEYSGNFYGLSKEEVDSKLEKDHSFVVVDREGMKQLNSYYPNCVNILLYASKRDCMINMLDRGDDMDKVNSRLSTYEEETSDTDIFDYVIKNNRGLFGHTVALVRQLICNEENANRGVRDK